MSRLLLVLALLGGCGYQSATRHEPSLRAATDPKELRALRADLIETYVRVGAVDLAAPLVREALHDEPQSARLITLHGAVLLERGLVILAGEQARAALAIDSKFAPAYGLTGRVEQRRGRRVEAVLAHQRATELAAGCSRCWNNLGFSLFLAGRDREAVNAYEQGLKIDSNARTIYNNLGFAYCRLGDEAAAIRVFRQSVPETEIETNLEICRQLRARQDAPALQNKLLEEKP